MRALLFQFFAHLYDVYGPSSSDPFRDGCAKGKTVCQLACCSLHHKTLPFAAMRYACR